MEMSRNTRLFTFATLTSAYVMSMFALLMFPPLGVLLIGFCVFLTYGAWVKYHPTKDQRAAAARTAQLIRRSKGDRR